MDRTKILLFNPLLGTVLSHEQQSLKKLLFRASRGKAYVQFFPLEEKVFDYYGNELDITLYFVVHPQGSLYLRDRLRKVCDSFSGERFELPRTREEIEEKVTRAQ